MCRRSPDATMPEQEAASTISARGLTRSFGNHIAVNNVTLELRRGEVLGFLGPNGAGKDRKSTRLNSSHRL